MSKIGKKPIILPVGVSVHVVDGLITVKGPKGELSYQYHPSVTPHIEENQLFFTIDSADNFKFW